MLSTMKQKLMLCEKRSQQVSQVANMNRKQKKVRQHVKGVIFRTETPLDVLITCQLHTATLGY